LYLQQYFESVRDRVELVEFAPTPPLRRFIKKFPQVNYRSADLYSDDVEDKVDLTRMDIYSAGQFDFLISSHMLEHIEDDFAAMRELHRILKPGGAGIVMVPIDLSLNEVYENPALKTEEERWKHFAQYDHVRLYSKEGFIRRLESVGFRVEQLGSDHFGSEKLEKAGIHRRSVLYVVHK
jgi:SAM-dependent methyltransferase